MLTKDEKKYLTQVTEHWFDHLKPEDWFAQSDQIDQGIGRGDKERQRLQQPYYLSKQQQHRQQHP